jgi:hypothetical protein
VTDEFRRFGRSKVQINHRKLDTRVDSASKALLAGDLVAVIALSAGAEQAALAVLKYITEVEIGEAFAATRGVASPTQLRAALKRDDRDPLEFRELAPERRPVAIQRWSVRRFVLRLSVLVVVALVAFLVVGNWAGRPVKRPPRRACRASSYPQMLCGDDSRQNILHLVAQAVPSATLIPCIKRLHPGWSHGGSEVTSGFVHFWLNSNRVDVDAVGGSRSVTLLPRVNHSIERQIDGTAIGTG